MSTDIDIKDIIHLAEQAGEAIMTIYGQGDFEVQHKADESPLTAADLASHKTIVAGLEALTPDIPILSEEGAATPWPERRTWTRYWLIDPLDGTREFVKRNGEFTVNIALIEDGVPTLGVVLAPATGLCFYADVAGGAWQRRPNQAAERITASEADGPARIVGSRSHRGDSLNALLDAIGEHEMVAMGSSLKLCLVAAGEADLYPRLGPTSEWDTAAAQAVVEAAGGKVTHLDGSPLRYNTKDELLNPHFLVFPANGRDWPGLLKNLQ